MFDLSSKTAIVTGAGSGIGRAIAQVLADAGAFVGVWDRDRHAAQETCDLVGEGRSQAKEVDVADPDAVREAAASLQAQRSRIDILINNAGVASVGNLEHASASEMDRLYQINVKGVYHCLHAVVPRMVDGGGGVVLNIGSIASLTGIKDRFAYSMTKGAVLTMTYSVAIDYADRGVRCNCICPARVHTPFVDAFVADNYPGQEQAMIKQLSEYQPLGRMAEPAEVAAMALYLCSDEARFLTGTAYPIDGGVLHAR